MNLTTARQIVFKGALHAEEAPDDTSQYGVINADLAIMFVCNDFANEVRCLVTNTTIALTSGSGTEIINPRSTSGMEQFDEAMFISATVSRYQVDKVAPHVIDRHFQGATPTGRPTRLGFDGPTRMLLYPKPDASYSMNVTWWAPFTNFTAGEASPAGVTLTLPDRWLHPILRFGAAAAMVYNDPDALYASQGWQVYARIRDEARAQYERPIVGQQQVDPRVRADYPATPPKG